MDEQKAAKDIRIYQQQNEIIGQLASAFGVFHAFIFQRGKKEARNLALRSCFAQLLTVASYVIVCIRAVMEFIQLEQLFNMWEQLFSFQREYGCLRHHYR